MTLLPEEAAGKFHRRAVSERLDYLGDDVIPVQSLGQVVSIRGEVYTSLSAAGVTGASSGLWLLRMVILKVTSAAGLRGARDYELRDGTGVFGLFRIAAPAVNGTATLNIMVEPPLLLQAGDTDFNADTDIDAAQTNTNILIEAIT